jgi:hypothetical protein
MWLYYVNGKENTSVHFSNVFANIDYTVFLLFSVLCYSLIVLYKIVRCSWKSCTANILLSQICFIFLCGLETSTKICQKYISTLVLSVMGKSQIAISISIPLQSFNFFSIPTFSSLHLYSHLSQPHPNPIPFRVGIGLTITGCEPLEICAYFRFGGLHLWALEWRWS